MDNPNNNLLLLPVVKDIRLKKGGFFMADALFGGIFKDKLAFTLFLILILLILGWF